jgi:hypothetical protein
MSTRVAPTQAIATHGVVDIAALDEAYTKASGGGYMQVGATCAVAEVATADEVAVQELEILADQDGVQVSPRVHALKMEQACVFRWEVASVE